MRERGVRGGGGLFWGVIVSVTLENFIQPVFFLQGMVDIERSHFWQLLQVCRLNRQSSSELTANSERHDKMMSLITLI